MLSRGLMACIIAASCAGIPSIAHAKLDASTRSISRPSEPAADLTLTFSNRIDLEASHFELTDQDRNAIRFEDARLSQNGTDVILPIRARLKPGSYTMRWRALSSEGIAEEGSYSFEVER